MKCFVAVPLHISRTPRGDDVASSRARTRFQMSTQGAQGRHAIHGHRAPESMIMPHLHDPTISCKSAARASRSLHCFSGHLVTPAGYACHVSTDPYAGPTFYSTTLYVYMPAWSTRGLQRADKQQQPVPGLSGVSRGLCLGK